MQVRTKAIVISAIKYAESSLIVKCYTEEEGIKSYLLQGILKKKKGKINKSHFLPLSILQINASHNGKGNLNRIAEATVLHPFLTLHTDFVKQSIVFFLSEFLNAILTEEEGTHHVLFDFLEQTFLWLDQSKQVANFPLIFLIELTKCLGFYPDLTNKQQMPFFDLREGCYVANNSFDTVQGEELLLLNKALGIKFDRLDKTLLSKTQRTVILELLLKYYQLQISSFRRPKSLEVLSTILA